VQASTESSLECGRLRGSARECGVVQSRVIKMEGECLTEAKFGI